MGGRGRWPTVAGKINDGRVHGRNCRATGCDCPERKAAHAAYMRERRAKAKAAKAQMGRLRAVPSTADRVPSAQPGSVDRGGQLRVAALSEIASIPDVEAAHPLLIASILALVDAVGAAWPDPVSSVPSVVR